MPSPARTSATGEGLRARRRRETEHTIHASAVRLVETHGPAGVTVDMISAAAGISQRTFFNYFPSKESALTSSPRPLPDTLRRRLTHGDPEPRATLAELVDVLAEHITDSVVPDRELVRATFRIAERHPELRAALHAGFDAFEEQVREAVAERIAAPPGDPQPRLLTGIALSVARTALEQWSLGTDEDHASPEPDLRRCVELLHTLMPRA
ncbi:TetR family transcriptional regulator [Streptomyces sp. NPDC046821]|uniref:acyl-CoA-like ligand-binding transcription factor n=1 Tax=Streptomyces sp. NPDC046821 TaxID=3154702 RepID=UPI0033C73DAC